MITSATVELAVELALAAVRRQLEVERGERPGLDLDEVLEGGRRAARAGRLVLDALGDGLQVDDLRLVLEQVAGLVEYARTEHADDEAGPSPAAAPAPRVVPDLDRLVRLSPSAVRSRLAERRWERLAAATAEALAPPLADVESEVDEVPTVVGVSP